jgi:membrane protein DedA with SNARE-associated domain
MPLKSLIAPYGYLGVFFWAPFEGDWALVLGALAARLGYLQLHWVILMGAASVFLPELAGAFQAPFLMPSVMSRKYLS